jgi:hypothetical protein
VNDGDVRAPRADRARGLTGSSEKKAQMKQNDGRQSI